MPSETETIPCVSLWQPWATLMEIGAKTNETRSWETLYRGPLAIHAALKWNGALARYVVDEPFRAALDHLWPDGTSAHDMGGKTLPLGAILCVVNLLDCVRITAENAPPADSPEFAFGDYTPGRFMWKTSLIRRLDKPMPFKGHQRMFRVPASLFTKESLNAP